MSAAASRCLLQWREWWNQTCGQRIFIIRGTTGDYLLAQIQVRENESLDGALKRFKKRIEETGILKEAKRHEHYEKPSDRRRRADAARRRKLRSEIEKAK